MHSFFSCCCHCRNPHLPTTMQNFATCPIQATSTHESICRVHISAIMATSNKTPLSVTPAATYAKPRHGRGHVETEGLHKLCVSSAIAAIICWFQKRRRAPGREQSCLCVHPFASCSPDAGLASRSKGVPQTPACRSRSGDTLRRRIRWCPGRNLDNN